jgi:hypothetical protein
LSAQWEVQKALYDALSADSAFMTKIGSRLYDEPPTNETFPYVTLGYMIENKYNRMNNKGFEITARIDIYTKSGRLGYKPAKEILVEMNRVLNLKSFELNGFFMIQCYYETSDTERDEDKRILSVRYTVLCQEVLVPTSTLVPDIDLFPLTL